jgi:hypothetical protein
MKEILLIFSVLLPMTAWSSGDMTRKTAKALLEVESVDRAKEAVEVKVIDGVESVLGRQGFAVLAFAGKVASNEGIALKTKALGARCDTFLSHDEIEIRMAWSF